MYVCITHRPSGVQGTGGGATQAVRGSGDGRRGTTDRQGVWGREEGLHRLSEGVGAGGGATQAVRGSGGGRRGYTGRQGFRGRDEGLHRLSGIQGPEEGHHRPSGGVGAGGVVTGAMGCCNTIYIVIKENVKLSMQLKVKVILLGVI